MVVILGPTSSGKSDLAVELARKFGGEVISADSRQVYKGLNIGTGKITKKEMKGVKHHLLDVADPRKKFTAADFVRATNVTAVKIVAKGKIPIVCGGTGFYIDALLGDKQIPEVRPNLKLRKGLEKKSVEELFKILQKLDPERARNIDAKNPRRLVRAIEICEALGKVPRAESRSTNYEVCKIGIKIDEKELKERINKRLEKRLKQGMIREAQNLHKKGLSYKRMRELGLEYRALADFLSRRLQSASQPKASGQKKISKDEMLDRLQSEIWHYAKRQMTWFKRDKNIIWLPPKIGLVEKEVRKFLN